MAVTIRIADMEATIKDGTWHCADKGLLSILNSSKGGYRQSAADPNPDYMYALAAIKQFGEGEILARDKIARDPDVIY